MINPVVLTATAVAFPDSPAMVVARLLATAAAMGWLWLGRGGWAPLRWTSHGVREDR
ncbi:hypothetical protein ACFV2H_18560 [Streptomyces sp. NPDC059629]|uniref:hypothetical protein n=1 Tax=Streptomyces sp. NPDC059629 TaxID=3346889 RepID=UPI0036A0F9C1